MCIRLWAVVIRAHWVCRASASSTRNPAAVLGAWSDGWSGGKRRPSTVGRGSVVAADGSEVWLDAAGDTTRDRR